MAANAISLPLVLLAVALVLNRSIEMPLDSQFGLANRIGGNRLIRFYRRGGFAVARCSQYEILGRLCMRRDTV